ncbi:hypothetical protein ASG42_28510 [Rhizobium sp. Leaf391]|nr:hypothetical protein [Rhizobium sp. Leaf391]KQS96832.1 hypothetical protein ASG42_28510 [Rhizobium sp. Leaf391]
MAYLVEILLPATYPVPNTEKLSRVRDELTAKFGGVMLHLDSPAEGVWKDGDVERDRIVIVEVMTDDLDRSFWSRYREELEGRFRQYELVIRASEIERL